MVPARLVARAGDRSVVLHWETSAKPSSPGVFVYRSEHENGPWVRLTDQPLQRAGLADVQVTNGHPYFYQVRTAGPAATTGVPSKTVRAEPREFADDAAFLDYVQQTAFDYFWYEANPVNGLVRDRSTPDSPCSIAAVGFGLTAIGVGIDHRWITRPEGRDRVLRTLETFWTGPQGADPTGMMGQRGWFYHFLDLQTGQRTWTCELSSIDTAWFLAGALYARQYFAGDDPAETSIRRLVNSILEHVDWHWMANGGASLSMGWKPESKFLRARWIGFNEAMLLYLLGLGVARDPLPPAFWESWVSGYRWQTSYGQSYVHFAPLFGHQYSHCWIDFRGVADGFLRRHDLDYFENSRRATLAQQAYCIANPGGFPGYSERVWGLTACDGPGTPGFHGYMARGAPPGENDDGTIAPTAVAGSFPFAPEVCLPTLRHLYDQFHANIWRPYGFCDAFNLKANWWDPDVIGIDQGPILLMIENHRTQRVWKTFMTAPEIRRGLEAAGFRAFP